MTRGAAGATTSSSKSGTPYTLGIQRIWSPGLISTSSLPTDVVRWFTLSIQDHDQSDGEATDPIRVINALGVPKL